MVPFARLLILALLVVTTVKDAEASPLPGVRANFTLTGPHPPPKSPFHFQISVGLVGLMIVLFIAFACIVGREVETGTCCCCCLGSGDSVTVTLIGDHPRRMRMTGRFDLPPAAAGVKKNRGDSRIRSVVRKALLRTA